MNLKEKLKKSVSGEERRKNLRYGSYSFAVTAIVILLVVVVNLVAGQLPASAMELDASTEKLYSIGDETRNWWAIWRKMWSCITLSQGEMRMISSANWWIAMANCPLILRLKK